ncbi:adenosylcobinamide-phosphate synthase CbiB [Trichlorobacter ammonificans]|uniref:Cobalamin biosynthesis protein CobD n=1 Tax=Trichlorobacter ammonificans TaxID=2916410 RepID=A0ABN8HGV1_9BACT|nr:adenosylcobinamide-phosphate synthase CbiB [Trichlorobacter ammonificans]CAH2032026.1 Cobalamin biosynthesis protein CobD [Trichlorobacter ammonificans]
MFLPTPELLAAALLLDLLLADPRWLPHPVVGIGRLIALQERFYRRLGLDGYGGGLLLCCLTVLLTVAAAATLLRLLQLLSPLLAQAAGVLLAWTCLAARSLHRESALVVAALERDDLAAARQLLSRIVGRDTADLDREAILRAVVETVAENSSDGIIAPLFWLTVAGPVGGLAYKAINTLDSMVGYRNERYDRMGWASARLDDLANLLPARLTALLMVATAPLVGLSAGNGWRIWQRDHGNHPSPNSGHPEAAAAGVLGVRLGGGSFYGGVFKDKPCLGDPARPLDIAAYRGAVRLMYAATIAMTLLGIAFLTVLQ